MITIENAPLLIFCVVLKNSPKLRSFFLENVIIELKDGKVDNVKVS